VPAPNWIWITSFSAGTSIVTGNIAAHDSAAIVTSAIALARDRDGVAVARVEIVGLPAAVVMVVLSWISEFREPHR
jgi:hypothetical protein